MMLIVQYKNDKWASAQREFNNPRMFLSCQTRKINPAKISAFTVLHLAFKLVFIFNTCESALTFTT